MLRLIECVPNFSEGRDRRVLDSISAAINSVDGVKLLNVDPGVATNRTVFTFIGIPEKVLEAAFRAIKTAAELIDMSKHRGEHPRIGATDVCPFVPLAGVTMDECVELSKQLGRRVGEELGIPVYLYEYSATTPERKNLATIREGEYEGLAEKITRPEWKPDFGPAVFNPRTGATVIGARDFLIAYNVNVNTKDAKLAHEIALTIREGGRAAKDANGKIIKDASGATVKIPGRLKCCKAVGWYIDEYRTAQVSINLTNFRVTGIHDAFEAVREEAEKLGLVVTGSEIVGMVPKEALLQSGRFYLGKQGKSRGECEEELIRVAIQTMGLSSVSPFEPEKRILEYQFEKLDGTLRNLPIVKFADEVATDSPAPGGGSVAALATALGAGLATMVANLTVNKKGTENELKKEMETVAMNGQPLKDELLKLIDTDTEAFNKVMAAMRLPKKTVEEQKTRTEAIENASKEATLVPFSVLERSLKVIELAMAAIDKGNPASITDAATGLAMARAGALGAYLNVLINLQSIEDNAFCSDLLARARNLFEKAMAVSEEKLRSVTLMLEEKAAKKN